MTGLVEQLTQKLASLDRQTDELKAKLDLTYDSYLNVLQRVLRQQVLLACYHICTEGYPEEFVKLSMTQRHGLQTRLKTIAKDTGSALTKILTDPPPPPVQAPSFFSMPPDRFMADDDLADEETFTMGLEPSSLSEFSAGFSISRVESIGEMFEDDDDELDDDPDDEDSDEVDESDDDESDQEPIGRRPMTEADARELQSILAQVAAAITAKEPKTPVDRVLSWQDGIERTIQDKLCQAAYQINQALKNAELIPKQVPDRALEAASRADGDGATKIPHVIQMLVELGRVESKSDNSDNPSDKIPHNDDDSRDESKERSSTDSSGNANSSRNTAADRKQRSSMQRIPTLTHVTALQIRLAEVEFHDPLLMRWRRGLREHNLELQSLTREYRKYQRKRSVAEAQVAWRSTWLNDV
ncbi:MAG: hypothetical protein LH631_03480 [Alkalinema sp. CAN_BIN05]|nr:hypothetical protein [Alkalinema sp. CAN_BIN05]